MPEQPTSPGDIAPGQDVNAGNKSARIRASALGK
jgi:hypothetical protein